MKQKHALSITFFLVMILYNFATGFAHPVTPTLIIERQLPSQWYGYAMSAVSIGTFVIAPFWGKMCSYVSTKKLIILGNVGYILGQFIMCTANSGPQLLIGRVVAGILSCAATIGNLNYIMNIGEENQRGKYLTIYTTAGSVCNAAGYFAGGWLGILSVEAAFIGQGAVCFLAALLAFFTLEDDTLYKVKPERRMNIRDVNPFAAFADTRNFITIPLACFFTALTFIGMGVSCFENSVNYYIKDVFKLGSQYNGTIKAVIAACGLFANSVIAIRLIRRTDLNRTVVYCAGVLALLTSCALLGLGNMPVLALCYVMYSVSNFIYLSVCQNLVARQAKAETSNSMMGFYQGMRSLGSVIGSFIQANLYAANARWSFCFAVCSIIIGTLVILLFSVLQRRSVQTA